MPYTASEASALSIRLAPGTKAVAGELTRLQVYTGDAHGNYAKKVVAGDVVVVAALPASVERGGAATVVDGEGEVWVRVEEDTARFWIGAGSLPGGLAARHTEESPFVLKLESAGVAQLGLYADSILRRTPKPNPTPQPLTVTLSLTLKPHQVRRLGRAHPRGGADDRVRAHGGQLRQPCAPALP